MINRTQKRTQEEYIEYYSLIAHKKFLNRRRGLWGIFYQGKQLKIDGRYVWTSKHQAQDILWSKIGKRVCGRTDVQKDQKEEFRAKFMQFYEFKEIIVTPK